MHIFPGCINSQNYRLDSVNAFQKQKNNLKKQQQWKQRKAYVQDSHS
jgi:hypothetical protein